MAKIEKTANKQKSAKAVRVESAENVTSYVNELISGEMFAEFLNTTKNGTLKLSKSKPELSEDIHGTIKAGAVTIYLVSSGSSRSSVFSAFKSFVDYKDYLKRLAERAQNMKTFEDFCKTSANEWNKLAAIGIEISEEQKAKLYENYKAKFFAETPELPEESEE